MEEITSSKLNCDCKPWLLPLVDGSRQQLPFGPSMTITSEHNIALASAEDISHLSLIELAAATLLTGFAPPSVLMETTSNAEFEEAQRSGQLWVARKEGRPVGFAQVQILDPGQAHLKEVDVHPAHGRRGLGRQLVETVCAWAGAEGYRAITLTTFRDVPFNMPFYARLGFEVLSLEELSIALLLVIADESRRGLDPRRRVAMRRAITPPTKSHPGYSH